MFFSVALIAAAAPLADGANDGTKGSWFKADLSKERHLGRPGMVWVPGKLCAIPKAGQERAAYKAILKNGYAVEELTSNEKKEYGEIWKMVDGVEIVSRICGWGFTVVVGGFHESIAVDRLRSTKLFTRVMREPEEAGPDEESITLKIAKVFGQSEPDPEKGRKVIRDLMLAFFKSDDLVYVSPIRQKRNFLYEVDVEGPAKILAQTDDPYWYKITFTFAMHHQFGFRDDEFELQIGFYDVSRSKAPFNQRPPEERYVAQSDAGGKAGYLASSLAELVAQTYSGAWTPH
jgi:hypothetical protein